MMKLLCYCKLNIRTLIPKEFTRRWNFYNHVNLIII
jgi:hypothetical protein